MNYLFSLEYKIDLTVFDITSEHESCDSIARWLVLNYANKVRNKHSELFYPTAMDASSN